MTKLPWHADVRLAPQAASAVARAAFAMPCREVRSLGEGWDFLTYLTDDAWVLRFPKRQECDPALVRERALLDRVQTGDLPAATPVFVHLGSAPEAFPWHVGAYRYLPGVPLSEIGEPSIVAAVTRDLGVFLAALHRIPDVAEFTDPWPDDGTNWGLHALREAAEAYPPGLYARAEPVLAGPAPPLPDVPHVLAHADLFDEHVIVDPATGRLAAVIDWADAHCTVRTADFAGMHYAGGPDRTAIAYAAYGASPTPDEWRWLAHQAAAIGAAEVFYGFHAHLPERVEFALARLEALLPA